MAGSSASFLKLGRRKAALGWGTQQTPGSGHRREGEGLTELPGQTQEGAKGRQDVAKVRLSPEKGHLGAQWGGLWDPRVG